VYFPTRELASGFMHIRVTSENRWGELNTLAMTLATSGYVPNVNVKEDCPTFMEAYRDSDKMLSHTKAGHDLLKKLRQK